MLFYKIFQNIKSDTYDILKFNKDMRNNNLLYNSCNQNKYI